MQSILVIVQWLANSNMKIVRVITIMALVVCKNLTVRDMVTTTFSRKEDLLTITTTITTTGVGTKTVHRTCNVSILVTTVVETSTITIIRETSTTVITREISTTNSKTSTGKTIQEVITRIETSIKETCVVVMVGDTRTVLTVLTTIKGLLKVIKTSNKTTTMQISDTAIATMVIQISFTVLGAGLLNEIQILML